MPPSAVLSLVADRLDPPAGGAESVRSFATPGALAKYVDPRIVQTPALDILDGALQAAANGDCPRLIFTMPPQEGKSERVARTFPTWLLQRNPDLRIALVSYSDRLARRSGRNVRNDIETHPELGIDVAYGTRAANEWQLVDHDGGMITVSVGGALSGRAVDVLIIDDPFKDRGDADSEIIRQNVWDWWTDVGSARLGPNAIVVLVTTRWHEDDLVGRLMADQPDVWKIVNIAAQAEHDDELGAECKCGGRGGCAGGDPLGRKPGEFMISARGRSQTDWELRKRTAGSRAWSALYQGHPSPMEGGILKRAWFKHYPYPRVLPSPDGSMRVIGVDEVTLSIDCAFKDLSTSDYVCMQVWGRRGTKAWLIHQVWDRLDFVATCNTLRGLAAQYPQATRKLVEDKANGTAVMAALAGVVGGLVPITPTESKEARAHAVAPLLEAGDAEFPSPEFAPWVAGLIDEAADFPNGAHDDQVDAMTQYLGYTFLTGTNTGDFMEALLREQGAAHEPEIGSRPWSPQDVQV